MKNLTQSLKFSSVFTLRGLTGFMFILCSVLTCSTINAQSYENENLKKIEEEHVSTKNKKLGLKPNPGLNNVQILSTDFEISQNTKSESSETTISISKNALKLVDISAIDFDSKLDKLSVERIQDEIKSELNSLEGWFNLEESALIFKNKETGLSNKLEFKKVNNKLLSTCTTCDIQSFDIEENSANKITLITKNPDENEAYYIRYTFVK
jgi:hypothetical protein